MRLNRESGWKCKLPEWGMQPHRIRADKPGRADYPLLMRQCLRTHFDDLSATRSDETGAAAMVRCRCGRSRLRESAACSRDSVQLSARETWPRRNWMVQFSTRCMAQLRARTPQIMWRYVGKPEFPDLRVAGLAMGHTGPCAAPWGRPKKTMMRWNRRKGI